MRNRVNPRLKITQRCIGLNFYHIEFLNNHPNFQPDIYCRVVMDEQIKALDPKFWADVEKIKQEVANK